MLSDLLAHGHDIRVLTLPRGAAPLHCMAASVGYEQRAQEVYSWDGMKRGSAPFLVLQHTVLGEGRLDYAGSSWRLRPGQTMLVTTPHDHRYWLARGGHWEYFWAVLHGREALRLAREILAVAGPVLDIGPLVDRLAAACLTLLTTPRLTPGEASTAAYAAMSTLHDAVFGERPGPEKPLPAALARVADHVEAHLAETLTVDRLAAIAGISRAHFVRSFTAATGLPPSDFVTSRRMERIERLLLATEMRVSDIAAATGFADGNYLAKAFRRHRGLAPLEFRATRLEAN
ncbi:MAG: AraC family transcriptional regulator [bacterium]